MVRTGCLAFLLIVGCAVGPAFAEVKLQWQLKEGQTFYVEDKLSARQVLKAQGTDTPQELELTQISRFTVKSAGANKTVLEQKIESVKAAKTLASSARLLQRMEGAVFAITLDDRQAIAKFEGYEELIQRLAKEEPETRKTLRALIKPESLRREADILFSYLPDKSVSPGKSWEVRLSEPFGPLGTLDLVNKCSLTSDAKAEKGQAVIAVAASFTYSYPPAGTDSGLPFKITGGQLKEREGTATIHFDVSKGRLIRYEGQRRVELALSILAADQRLDIDVEQKQTTTCRVLDKNPLK